MALIMLILSPSLLYFGSVPMGQGSYGSASAFGGTDAETVVHRQEDAAGKAWILQAKVNAPS